MQLIEQRTKDREVALKDIEVETQARDVNKEHREKVKQEVFGGIEKERGDFKDKMAGIMAERNKYRDLISTRKDKDRALQDLIAGDKIDLGQLQKAIDEAKENLVREEVITKGNKYLAWFKYSKEVEGLLTQALADKNKEALAAAIERIEREQITIDAKMLQDAKNNLSKMK